MRAPVYKRSDSPYYWTWLYTADGRRRRVSTKRTDLKAATAEAARIQREASGAGGRAGGDSTLGQALDRYVRAHSEWAPGTLERNGSICLSLARALGTVLLRELRRDHIDAWVAQRLRTHRASTVHQELLRLYAALKHARQDGLFAGDVEALRVKVKVPPPQRHRWLTPAEVRQLCGELSADAGHWVYLACYTGCRTAEIRALAWEHVDFELGVLRVPGTKTAGSMRTIPLAAPLQELLEHRRDAGLPVAAPWKGAGTKLKAACARSGIPPCSPHDFRRTFASWLLQASVSHHAIADLLGHSGTQLVRQVYAHLGAADLRDAIRRLP